MGEHLIEIAFTPPDTFEYTSDGSDARQKRVKRRHNLKWKCAQGPWGIIFKDASPCDQRQATGRKGQANAPPLKVEGADGAYEYLVAIEHRGEIHFDDPEIIVDGEDTSG